MIFQKTDLDRIASLNLINQSFDGKKDLRFPFLILRRAPWFHIYLA